MNPSTLKAAINEAKRFIEKAEKVRIGNLHYSDDCLDKKLRGKSYDVIFPGKSVAACKRASLDLSRSLADLRAGK